MNGAKKRNSNPILSGVKSKATKNLLTESSEIEKNGNCIGNNPIVEAFFSTKQKSTEQRTIFFSPQQQFKKPKNIETRSFLLKSSRVELPPLNNNRNRYQKSPGHFKSSQTINALTKENDPVKAYDLYNETDNPASPINITKRRKSNAIQIKLGTRLNSSKILNYIQTESTLSQSSTSLNPPNKKKNSNSKIVIDLNNSATSKNKDSSESDIDDLALGSKSRIRHFEVSQTGKDEKGKTKTNQDNFIMLENLFDNNKINFFGVMDGHGSNGHLASEYVKKAIISYFSSPDLYVTKKTKIISPDLIYHKLTNKDCNIIKSFFSELNTELNTKAKFDVHFSGTTCVMVYQIDNKLICSNIGDSRAILITCDTSNNYYSEPLSYDHKPENKSERERIESRGGVLAPCNDEIDIGGPIRVWVKGEKYPGIAISRTLGDDVAHSVGVVSTPDVIVKDITDDMCFIVVASDGVWEFLSNDKVKDIVLQYYNRNDPKGAALQVVREASKFWKEEGLAMDDITCIVYFIKCKHVKKSTV